MVSLEGQGSYSSDPGDSLKGQCPAGFPTPWQNLRRSGGFVRSVGLSIMLVLWWLAGAFLFPVAVPLLMTVTGLTFSKIRETCVSVAVPPFYN